MLLFLIQYYHIIAAALGQFIIIFLVRFPVTDWEDDYIYCMTYIAIQMLFASFFFFIIPWLFELPHLQNWSYILMFSAILNLCIFRLLKIIPFEFSTLLTVKTEKIKELSFDSFYTRDRLRYLRSLNYETDEGDLRYRNFRERLVRLNKSSRDMIIDRNEQYDE